jgi:hypothetical protein
MQQQQHHHDRKILFKTLCKSESTGMVCHQQLQEQKQYSKVLFSRQKAATPNCKAAPSRLQYPPPASNTLSLSSSLEREGKKGKERQPPPQQLQARQRAIYLSIQPASSRASDSPLSTFCLPSVWWRLDFETPARQLLYSIFWRAGVACVRAFQRSSAASHALSPRGAT